MISFLLIVETINSSMTMERRKTTTNKKYVWSLVIWSKIFL